ncbi:MAG: alpha/beta hydrolase [Planctomycetota bacterium]|jgi:dipeptidyl aminopeptidase/acylaminoacyl peptidase
MTDSTFKFYSHGGPLKGTLTRPEDGPRRPAVLLCHGFGSYDDDIGGYVRFAAALAEAGIASLRFSFSGSDAYPDRGTIRPASRWVFDALAATDALADTDNVDGERIGLIGMSMGGAVAIQAGALDTRVRAVVALAPVSDGHQWLRSRWLAARGEPAWNDFVRQVRADAMLVARGEPSRVVDHADVQAFPDRAEWDRLLERYPRLLEKLTLASVADTFCVRAQNFAGDLAPRPLLVIQGDADESVPVEQTRALFEKAGETKALRILQGAPHCFWGTEWEAQVFDETANWLSEYL